MNIKNVTLWSKEIIEEINDSFHDACKSGDLAKVKNFLSIRKNEPKAEINSNNNFGFILACAGGHLEVVRYLLEDKKLKGKIGIQDYDDAAFKVAADFFNINILQYFIFECGIEKTNEIEIYLKKRNKHEIENLFTLREINFNLTNNLKQEIIELKKSKI